MKVRPRALVFAIALLTGCAGRSVPTEGPTPPQPRVYPELAELEHCGLVECTHSSLRMGEGNHSDEPRGRLPYVTERGHALHTAPKRSVRRLVIAIHGNLPTDRPLTEFLTPPSLFQFRALERAFHRARAQNPRLRRRELAIIAPTFQRTGQWEPYTEKDGRYWHWEGSTWNRGLLPSNLPQPEAKHAADPVSSFELLDEIIVRAMRKFPNLNQIVIVGHSAGGQAVQRYALLGTGAIERVEAHGISVRFVAANPGSYAFVTPVRKLPKSSNAPDVASDGTQNEQWVWRVPKRCRGYDTWHYGLGNLDDSPRTLQASQYAMRRYLPKVAPVAWPSVRELEVASPRWNRWARASLVYQYGRRDIWHLQAASDVEPYFTHSCRWKVQGRSRMERFRHHEEAWKLFNPYPKGARPRYLAVPGLEDSPHSSRAIYSSDVGLEALFD